jgi:hypothetical protein
MKRIFVSALMALSLILFGSISWAAQVKSGGKCEKLSAKVVLGSKTFRCERMGKKLRWVEVAKKAKPKFEFTSVCQVDPETPEEWKAEEKFLALGNHCPSFFKYLPYNMPNTQPKSQISSAENLLDVNNCKVKQPSSQYYPWRGFADPSDSRMTSYYSKYNSPRPVMRIQMIPITWSEYPSIDNPVRVNGKIVNFIKEWIENSSDNGSDVVLNTPDKYFMMPNPLAYYKDIDYHGQPTPSRREFWRDVIAATDSSIDYRDVTLGVVVVPPNVPLSKFSGNPDGSGMSQEGEIPHIITVPPLNLTEFHKNANFFNPHMILHELSHAGLDIGDYYNAGFWPSVGNGSSDQLGWDKYLEGFMNDKQIRCASINSESIHWLIPSVAKGPFTKLLVLPLSKSKVLVVESMRAAGYRYKLPKKYEGALVYTVDVSITEHGYGTDVLRPSRARFEPADGAKQDAALKVGESIIFEGVKISVIEAGEFGDVVKVEKA